MSPDFVTPAENNGSREAYSLFNASNEAIDDSIGGANIATEMAVHFGDEPYLEGSNPLVDAKDSTKQLYTF